MAKLKVYQKDGKMIEELEVSDKVFGLPEKGGLIHQVYVSIAANQRQVIAHTKNRGERAGSGIKPWRQKGTGRARVGSVRNPAWKKGGVAFGPRKEENYKKKINKKMNVEAIKSALSGKLRENEIFVLDKFDFSQKKTKEVAEIFNNLKIKNSTLMAFSENEKDLRIVSRNLEKVKNILINQINVLDILDCKNLVMTKESVKYLENKYGAEVKK